MSTESGNVGFAVGSWAARWLSRVSPSRWNSHPGFADTFGSSGRAILPGTAG